MQNKFISIFLFSILFFAFRPSGLVFIKSIPVRAQAITTDNLSYVYLLNNDVLQKCDPSGNPFRSYSNKTLGKITSVDASNPLKVVLFYRNFLQVVFLDNMLAQNGDPVSIESLGYPQTQLVCSSHNSGIWIYNQQNFELLRLNQDLQLVSQTGNLAQLLGIQLQPNFMLEYDNRLYVNNPSTGILVFDVFGTYNKTIPLYKLDNFQFKGNEIIYYQQGMLKSFNTLTLELGQSALPDSTAIGVRLIGDKLYLLKRDTLGFYFVK